MSVLSLNSYWIGRILDKSPQRRLKKLNRIGMNFNIRPIWNDRALAWFLKRSPQEEEEEEEEFTSRSENKEVENEVTKSAPRCMAATGVRLRSIIVSVPRSLHSEIGIPVTIVCGAAGTQPLVRYSGKWGMADARTCGSWVPGSSLLGYLANWKVLRMHLLHPVIEDPDASMSACQSCDAHLHNVPPSSGHYGVMMSRTTTSPW